MSHKALVGLLQNTCMYFLMNQQKSVCEAVWRQMTERDEMPLGLCRRLLPEDDKRARYVVAETVRLLPIDWLDRYVACEVDAYGPLRRDHHFRWDNRDMRAPSPVLRPPK